MNLFIRHKVATDPVTNRLVISNVVFSLCQLQKSQITYNSSTILKKKRFCWTHLSCFKESVETPCQIDMVADLKTRMSTSRIRLDHAYDQCLEVSAVCRLESIFDLYWPDNQELMYYCIFIVFVAWCFLWQNTALNINVRQHSWILRNND
jgi:hypothetical protein